MTILKDRMTNIGMLLLVVGLLGSFVSCIGISINTPRQYTYEMVGTITDESHVDYFDDGNLYRVYTLELDNTTNITTVVNFGNVVLIDDDIYQIGDVIGITGSMIVHDPSMGTPGNPVANAGFNIALVACIIAASTGLVICIGILWIDGRKKRMRT